MNRTSDPTVRAIEDALAFTTAAVGGDVVAAMATAREALREGGDDGLFLDAVVSTVQLIADEALDAGVDIGEVLRDVGLGVQVAHLVETGTTAPEHPPEHRS